MKVFLQDKSTGQKKELDTLEKGELKNTQIAVQALLGIDAPTFVRSVVLGQASPQTVHYLT